MTEDLSLEDVSPALLGIEYLVLALDYAMWLHTEFEGKPVPEDNEERVRGKAWDQLIWSVPGTQARYAVPCWLMQELGSEGSTFMEDYKQHKGIRRFPPPLPEPSQVSEPLPPFALTPEDSEIVRVLASRYPETMTQEAISSAARKPPISEKTVRNRLAGLRRARLTCRPHGEGIRCGKRSDWGSGSPPLDPSSTRPASGWLNGSSV